MFQIKELLGKKQMKKKTLKWGRGNYIVACKKERNASSHGDLENLLWSKHIKELMSKYIKRGARVDQCTESHQLSIITLVFSKGDPKRKKFEDICHLNFKPTPHPSSTH